MAILHQATLSPSKLELLQQYLPGISSLTPLLGDEIKLVGSYRFDDPAGAVGIETHLVSSGTGPLIQMPLTYRAEPLERAEAWLLGTMQHSVLGERWVYNAIGDPVYIGELLRLIATGGSESELVVQTPDGPVVRKPNVTVRGSGTLDLPSAAAPAGTSTIGETDLAWEGDDYSILAAMVLGASSTPSGDHVLTGTLLSDPTTMTLATATPR